MPRLWILPLLMVLPALATAATPVALQSHAAIRDAATAFATANLDGDADDINVRAANLDKRLRLHACSVPLEAFAPSGSGRIGQITVGVRCPDEKPWSLYVKVKIQQFSPVVVIKHAMPRGALLSKADLRVEKRDISKYHQGVIDEPDQAIGKLLKRSIPGGSVLQPTQLKAPKLVHRGESITIISQTNAISIRMNGKALADAGHGQRVRVRNSSSRRIVEGIVTGPGQVRVHM